MLSVRRGLPEQLQAQSEAAVEEEETGPPLGTKRQYLVVMRHGERMDEIDMSWRETSKRPWDPPLSDKGLPFHLLPDNQDAQTRRLRDLAYHPAVDTLLPCRPLQPQRN